MMLLLILALITRLQNQNHQNPLTMKEQLMNKIQKRIDQGAKTIGGVDVEQFKKSIKRKQKHLSNDKPVKK